MKYKVSNIKNHSNTRGWLCGQFFPEGDVLKTSNFEVKYFTMIPGETMAEHFHPTGEEIAIVIDGKMRVILDGNEHILQKGDFVFQQAGVHEIVDEIIEPTTIVAIRTPSIPNNKIAVEKK